MNRFRSLATRELLVDLEILLPPIRESIFGVLFVQQSMLTQHLAPALGERDVKSEHSCCLGTQSRAVFVEMAKKLIVGRQHPVKRFVILSI